MDVLDADDDPLIDSRGRKMLRDIVQFVPFKQFGNSPYALTKEILAEIPREIINFFKMKGIIPNPHIEAAKFEYERSYTVKSDAPDILYQPAPINFAQPAPNTYNYNTGNPPPPQAQGNYYSYNPPKY